MPLSSLYMQIHIQICMRPVLYLGFSNDIKLSQLFYLTYWMFRYEGLKSSKELKSWSTYWLRDISFLTACFRPNASESESISYLFYVRHVLRAISWGRRNALWKRSEALFFYITYRTRLRTTLAFSYCSSGFINMRFIIYLPVLNKRQFN